MERKEILNKMVPALIAWFEKNGRDLPWRRDASPYHVWLSEIMLQQTRIETVIPYYYRFLNEIPDIKSLAEADSDHLNKLWEGLGYYSRVKNLQIAAKQIMDEHGGVFPESYENIRKLKGIGDYTAGSISSICFDKPVPAVDGNVLRVLSRLTLDERSASNTKTRSQIREELLSVYPEKSCGKLTQGIMELGEIICIPNGEPLCSKCPCAEFCLSKDGLWNQFPVKEPKKERKKEKLTVFIIKVQGNTAIHKREDSGLLSGLWEFPNVNGNLSLDEAKSQMENWGMKAIRIEDRGFSKHIFSHIEWDMHCYFVQSDHMDKRYLWVSPCDLKKSFSLPTAFKKFME